MKNTIYGRKHREKRRNCLLQAISTFLTMFFYSCKCLVRQNAALCGNGLKRLLRLWLLLLKIRLRKTYCLIFTLNCPLYANTMHKKATMKFEIVQIRILSWKRLIGLFDTLRANTMTSSVDLYSLSIVFFLKKYCLHYRLTVISDELHRDKNYFCHIAVLIRISSGE